MPKYRKARKQTTGRPASTAKSGAAGTSGGTPRWLVPSAMVALAVVIIAVIAYTMVSGDGTPDDTNTVEVAKTVAVQGVVLPPLPDQGRDPAVGMTPPTLTGITPDGSALTLPLTGPSLTAVVAHWCPHCQREVPIVTRVRRSADWPTNVTLSALSTGVRAERGNYPPSAWLTSAGWQAPVLVDDARQTGADALGLTGLPFIVWTDATGKVVLRTAGEIPETTFVRMVQQLGRGETPTLSGP